MAIIVLKDAESHREVTNILVEAGVEYRRITFCNKHIIVAWPDSKVKNINLDLPQVEAVIFTRTPYMLASREFVDKIVFDIGNVKVNTSDLLIIAGPCAVEKEEYVLETARLVKKAGAHVLRGGAFKPRTSPYSFQGLGEEGLKILRKAREETGLPVVTEVMDTRHVDLVSRYVDILQIGARNCQNFYLLKEVGKTRKPILLKRGFGVLIDEWILCAEYIMLEENEKVILVERGIRTFEKSTRFTLDIAAVPIVKQRTNLPIIVDPSHPAGRRELVEPLALAGIAAGADGIIVEVHVEPEKALCDAEQQLTPEQFRDLMNKIRGLAEVLGRRVP
ncbi:MAG: 3-deoxy-7-phosphoheptulonate synthase [Crenarchaeota archaeon]|nr:3-deoxy-7-phosphoheptulonate synthase [Thermoproteota archaeon]